MKNYFAFTLNLVLRGAIFKCIFADKRALFSRCFSTLLIITICFVVRRGSVSQPHMW